MTEGGVLTDGNGAMLLLAPGTSEKEAGGQGEKVGGGSQGSGGEGGNEFGGDGSGVCQQCDGCDCCWHVDFVGGAPRRGHAGHDVDLLVWHRTKESSWGAAPDQSVLGLLLKELEARAERGEGGVIPRKQGWQMPRRAHDSRQVVAGVRAHRRDAQACTEGTHGFENLSQDFHDKVSYTFPFSLASADLTDPDPD